MALNGYWKYRGFFKVYVNGKHIGSYPTPEQAEAAIREYKDKPQKE